MLGQWQGLAHARSQCLVTAAARAHWPSTGQLHAARPPPLCEAGRKRVWKVHQSLENADLSTGDIPGHTLRRTSNQNTNDTCLQAGAGIRTFLHCW